MFFFRGYRSGTLVVNRLSDIQANIIQVSILGLLSSL